MITKYRMVSVTTGHFFVQKRSIWTLWIWVNCHTRGFNDKEHAYKEMSALRAGQWPIVEIFND